MSTVRVDAELNTADYNAGLASIRKNTDAFGKEAAQLGGPMLGKVAGLVSRGLGPAAIAMGVIAAAGATIRAGWSHINDEAKKFTERGLEAGKGAAGLAAAMGQAWTFTKNFAAASAAAITGMSSAADSGWFDVFADEERSALAAEKAIKRLDEAHKKHAEDLVKVAAINQEIALEESKMTGDSAAERSYNIELEIKSLEKKKSATNDIVEQAKIQLELSKKQRDLEKSRADEAKYVKDLFKDQLQDAEKITDTLAANKKKVTDVIDAATKKRNEASTPTAVTSGRLSAGISLAGERAAFVTKDKTIAKLDDQLKEMKKVVANTDALKDISKVDLSLK
jgi:hypothetical protein